MKRQKTVSVALTLEEWKELRKKMREKEDADEKSYGLSSYIRSYCIQPHLNGSVPPTIPDSEQKNVSPVLKDTLSKLPEGWTDFE